MMKSRKKIIDKYIQMNVAAKAAFWALIAGVIQKGINVLATPIFTRMLTTEEYAQYTLYQSWHDIFIIFTSLYVYNYATYTAMVKYESDKKGFISSAQSFVTLLTLVGFGIYYLIHILIGDVIEFSMPIVILMFADMLFVSAFNLWSAKERYEFHYRLMTLLSILIGIMGPFLGIVLTKSIADKGYGRIYGVAFVNIFVGAIFYIINYQNSRKFYVKEYWQYILTFCVPLIPHFLSAQVLTRFDRIMINEMCGASKTGIYSLAYSVSMLMSIINDAVLKAYTPWMYQALKSNNADKIKKVTNVVILLVAVSNIILILFAPEAIKIFATSEYMEAVYIIPAVSASVYFTFLYNIFANIEYYFSETKPMAIASIIAAVVNIILNYIFIPIFGFVAAGYTTLASYMLYSIGHYLFMKQVSKKHANGYKFYDEKGILILSCIFTLFSLGIVFLYNSTFLRYMYIVIIMLIIMIKRKDINSFIKVLRKKEEQ